MKLHAVSREMTLHPETHATRSDQSKLKLLLSALHAQDPHSFEETTRTLISMQKLHEVKVGIRRVDRGAPLEMELTGPTRTIMKIAEAYMNVKGVSTRALTHR